MASRVSYSIIEGIIRQNTNNPIKKSTKMSTYRINYEDVYVVDTFEEASEFFRESDNQPVEVGTAVGYDVQTAGGPVLHCFAGIYWCPEQVNV